MTKPTAPFLCLFLAFVTLIPCSIGLEEDEIAVSRRPKQEAVEVAEKHKSGAKTLLRRKKRAESPFIDMGWMQQEEESASDTSSQRDEWGIASMDEDAIIATRVLMGSFSHSFSTTPPLPTVSPTMRQPMPPTTMTEPPVAMPTLPLPTASPTIGPSMPATTTTEPPVASPQPTDEPTAEPSQTPTQDPTQDPTQEPTMTESDQVPSTSPSQVSQAVDPTSLPTPSPSEVATPEPSNNPTQSLIVDPTTPPTPSPSEAMTPEPRDNPTQRPTTDPTTRPTAPSPTKPPTQRPGVDIGGFIELEPCREAINESDLDNDNRVNQTEYVTFVNLLSDDAFSDADFSALPENLRATFVALACQCVTIEEPDCCINDKAHISADGSDPDDVPTEAQEAYLFTACLATNRAIAESLS